ncbi:hypothetical protein [Hyphomicrobium sulfonivorans]|nr:hypothetical protein [Hyphomicrobium sulfonivorans]
MQSKTANKSISMLRTMLVKINKSKKLKLTELLDDIYFAPEQHYE